MRDASVGIGVFPVDRLGGLGIGVDVAAWLASQIGCGSEGAASDEVALQLREPQLDLIEPRRLSRREVQLNFVVGCEELGHLLGFVS